MPRICVKLDNPNAPRSTRTSWTRDDVVANIAYTASENRRQLGPSGKHDRERVTYCTTQEHVRRVWQGGPGAQGHWRYRKCVYMKSATILFYQSQNGRTATLNQNKVLCSHYARFGTAFHLTRKSTSMKTAHLLHLVIAAPCCCYGALGFCNWALPAMTIIATNKSKDT